MRVWSADATGARARETGAPNTSFQPTAARARSFGFYAFYCGALAAAELHRWAGFSAVSSTMFEGTFWLVDAANTSYRPSTESRVGCRRVVLRVVPGNVGSTLVQTNARGAGRDSVSVVPPNPVARIASALENLCLFYSRWQGPTRLRT